MNTKQLLNNFRKNLTLENKQKAINLANDLYLLELEEIRVNLIVTKVSKELLEEKLYYPEEKRKGIKNEPILNPENTYDMNDKDFKEYLTIRNERLKPYGLNQKDPEYCSLLIAQDNVRKKEKELFDFSIELLPNKEMKELFKQFSCHPAKDNNGNIKYNKAGKMLFNMDIYNNLFISLVNGFKKEMAA